MTSDCESDTQYDAELERILARYEEAVRKEKRLINSTRYELNHPCAFSIECGLSAARTFNPAVRIINKFNDDSNISFNKEEWDEFIKIIQKSVVDYFEAEPASEQFVFELNENISVTMGMEGYHIKMVVLTGSYPSSTTNFHMMKSDIMEVLQLDRLVSKKLIMLSNLDFCNYYYRVLENLGDIKENFHLPVLDLIYTFCFVNDSIESYCMFECLQYLGDKVLYDFERNI